MKIDVFVRDSFEDSDRFPVDRNALHRFVKSEVARHFGVEMEVSLFLEPASEEGTWWNRLPRHQVNNIEDWHDVEKTGEGAWIQATDDRFIDWDSAP